MTKNSTFTFSLTFTIEEVLDFETGSRTLRQMLVDAAWDDVRVSFEAKKQRNLFWAIEDLAGDRFETEILLDGDHLDVVIRDKCPGEALVLEEID